MDSEAMDAPWVSVVLPAYQSARFVAAAVESIHAQTWPRVELIAVDDGSTDGTGDLLDRLRSHWEGPGRRMIVLRQPNAGAGAARNAGLGRATGAFVALYDADDIYHPTLTERMVELLSARPELDLAFALYRYVDEDGRPQGTQPPPVTDRLGAEDLLADNLVHAPLFRRAILEDTGAMDTDLQAHIDLDFFLRVAERRPRPIGVVPEALSDYRRHERQITSDWRRMRRNYLAVLERRAARGFVLTGGARRRIFARLRLYWATLAYQAGRHSEARRLALGALAGAPAEVLGDRHGRVRLLACAASLLPPPLHDRLRAWHNARDAA